MKHLWIIVLFVLVPISMIVSDVRAEKTSFQDYIPQPPPISEELTVWEFLQEERLFLPDTMSDYIDDNDFVIYKVNVFPKIRIVEIQYMDKELFNRIKQGDFREYMARVRASFCTDVTHIGNRCLTFEVFINSRWLRPYTHPEVKSKKRGV